jgi:hypothetical protein
LRPAASQKRSRDIVAVSLGSLCGVGRRHPIAIGVVGLGDAESRSALDERALIGSRLIFGWHFPLRVAQPRDARARGGKLSPLEEGVVTTSDRGTGQGSVISPLLANIYLHYVFDLWAERWRRREATGNVIITRYADDIVIGFERESDARRFLDMMRARFEAFALTLHTEKPRLIEFGRFAAHNRARRGLGKPETFNFLGFTLICGSSRRGKFLLKRKPAATACERNSGRPKRS